MGVSQGGDPPIGDPPEALVEESLGLNNVECVDSPRGGRVLRNSPFQNRSTRARLEKSKPKSPLLRMAEMKRAGLRGRKVRKTELKGLGATDLCYVGGDLMDVAPSLEDSVVEADKKRRSLVATGSGGLVDGSKSGGAEGEGGDMLTDVEMVGDLVLPSKNALIGQEKVMGKDLQSKELDYKLALQHGLLSAVGLTDFSLDLVVAQPLQEMDFVAEQGDLNEEFSGVGSLQVDQFCLVGRGTLCEEGRDGDTQPNVLRMEEDFPLLSKENLISAKGKGKHRDTSGGNQESLPMGEG